MTEKKSKFAQLAAGAALSAASGVLLWMSFPPMSKGALAWVALVPLYVAVLRLAPTAVAFGLYYGIAATVWLAIYTVGIPPDYQSLHVLPPVVFILFFVMTFWQRNLATRNHFRYFTALVATQFVAGEYWRQSSPAGQFGFLGLTQYRHPLNIQIASWFGVTGITLLVVLVNCTLALIAANLTTLRNVRVQVAVNVIIVAAIMGVNVHLMRAPVPVKRNLRVAAIQIGYVPEAKTHPGLENLHNMMVADNLKGYTATAEDLMTPLTERAAAGGAKLVVWPECSLGTDRKKDPASARRLTDLARKTNAWMVVPFTEPVKGQEHAANPDTVNAADVISPDGRFVDRYYKHHRIIPLGIDRGPSGTREVVPRTNIGRMGIMICYDADFPDVANKYAKKGLEYFVLPSHDLAMFITRIHPVMLMFRAVEHRRSLVKADYVHGTMIVDPKGRILADPPDGLQVAEADIPLTDVSTPFPWLSVVFGFGATVMMIIFLVAAWRQKEAKV